MDWHRRAVLAWRISNTLDAGFLRGRLSDRAASRRGPPASMNTDQGVQFTGQEWITAVATSGGKGRWLDNVFIERLWRSLQCEDLYLLRDDRAPGGTGTGCEALVQ